MGSDKAKTKEVLVYDESMECGKTVNIS